MHPCNEARTIYYIYFIIGKEKYKNKFSHIHKCDTKVICVTQCYANQLLHREYVFMMNFRTEQHSNLRDLSFWEKGRLSSTTTV